MDSEGSIEHVLPELVRDSELKETVIDGDYTIHRQPISLRTRSRNDTWIRETKLGRGGYGEVWLEKKVHGDASLPRLRAVKRMHFPENETIFQFNRGRYVRELEALAKFSQDKYKDFFVRSYGWYIARGYLNIAMEYCPLSDLKAYLERVKTIPTQEVHEIAIQVLEALTWMHRNEFAHRDLKPANILIQAHPPEEWWVKLCDFGLSKREEAAAESSTVRGTPSFMAPEAIGFPFAGDPKKASPYLTDMWCFGETLFRCHTGQAAFEDREQLYKYQQDSNLFPSGPLRRVRASALAIDFIWSIMWPDPSERCDTKAARRHPWVRVQDKPLPGTVSQTKTESPPQQTGVEQRSTGPPAEAPEVRVDSELTDASGQWSITATSTNHVRNEPLANGYNQDHPENRNRPQPSLLASSKHDRVPYSKTIAPSNKDQSASRNEERNVTLADHVKARRGYYQLEEEPDSPRQATPRAESGNTSDAHDDDGGDDSDDAWEVLESSDADDESYSVTATPSRRSSATPHTRGKRTDHHDTSYAVDATPSREPRPRDTKEAGIKRTDRTKSAKTSSEARKEKIRSPQSKDVKKTGSRGPNRPKIEEAGTKRTDRTKSATYLVTATLFPRPSATPRTRRKRTDHHDTSYTGNAIPSHEPQPKDAKEAGIKRTNRTKSAKTSSEARKEKIRSPHSKDAKKTGSTGPDRPKIRTAEKRSRPQEENKGGPHRTDVSEEGNPRYWPQGGRKTRS